MSNKPDPRTLAKACRCQLLVGSYEGGTRLCPCLNLLLCRLSEHELEEFRDNPKVLEAKYVNEKEYVALTASSRK